MSKDLSLAARLTLDANRWTQGLGVAEKGTKGFVAGAKRELASLKNAFGTVQGQLATLGITVGAAALIMQSAKMDKLLTQIGQTAGASKKQVSGLRAELFQMSGETGQNVDDLQSGFNVLIQSGLTWSESLAVIDATNKAMAVTGAQAETLTGALGVSATAFNFDLSKPNQALILLDKMTVAGRKGNAELEDLSSIVSRVGVNAAGAGFGFDKTLAFVEGLSMIERQPERLATLADSTLRLFTNAKYMQSSQKATGVAFFGKDGGRRDPIEVLSDIKRKFDALRTDAQRQNFLTKAFGQADLDTIKGLKTLLSGGTLSNIKQFTSEIGNAGGAIQRDLPGAVNNAVDQAGRLKAVLRDAADGFAKPVNDSLSKLIKHGLDSKKDGGLGLSGGQIAGGGIAALLALYLGKRGGSALLGKMFGAASGVAQGKALEAAAGVMPVYVVNMSDGGMGAGGISVPGLPGGLAKKAAPLLARLALLGGSSVGSLASAGGIGALAGGVSVAGAGGYAVGTGINKAFIEGTSFGDAIGSGIARALALVNFGESREAIANAKKYQDTLNIEITANGQAVVRQATSNNPNRNINVNTGRMFSRGRH